MRCFCQYRNVLKEVTQGVARFLRPVEEEEMDRNAAIERAWPTDFRSIGEELLRSPRHAGRLEWKSAFWLSRGEALILVLLLSFGLWAAIWGVVILLVADGRW